jgi:hypothetical protein
VNLSTDRNGIYSRKAKYNFMICPICQQYYETGCTNLDCISALIIRNWVKRHGIKREFVKRFNVEEGEVGMMMTRAERDEHFPDWREVEK